jgi:hypothetical protein
MATYKEIKGVTVQTLDSDPVLNVNSWSSGGSMTTDRQRMGGDGTQTALIVAGGTTPSPSDQKALTETYNGSSFTEVGDLNTGRTDLALAGTTTAALAATGSAATGYGTFVESWNGSSWTETTENNTQRVQLAAFGIQTAMVIAGGLAPPFTGATEYWNGSSWTELNDLNTARQGLTNCGAGVYTAGMVAGGRKAHPSDPGQEAADTETWNATSWTEVNNLNEAKQLGGVFGTSTSAIYAGGADTATLAAVESWDGTNWTETSDLATARYNVSAGGTSNTSGIIVGGTPGAATEEWSLPPPTSTILTEGDIFLSGGTTLKGFGKAAGIPATAWSSGGSLNTGRRGGGGAGVSNTAALVWGGETIPPPTASKTETESYNGTTWTEVADLNTKNADQSFSGTQTAAIGGGGNNPDPVAIAESWNGSTWTEVSDLNAARYNGGSIGFTASAHNFVGGLAAPVDQNNEFWDGTSWTEQNNLNTGRYNMFGFGNPASGFVGGGLEPSLSGKVESWDGTSWTETTDLNTARVACRGTGNTSSGIVFGGGTPSATGKTEFWNGSSWTEINDMSSGRATIMPNRSGGAVSAIAAGGPSSSALTEEWTSDNTLSTVTVS